MLKRYWFIFVAFGLVALVGEAKAQVAPNVATDGPSIENVSPGAASEKAEGVDGFSVPVEIIEDPRDRERTERREADSDKRERDDLAAQQSMAESTEQIVVVSWWQLGLATAGTFAVFLSIFAAFRANGITREVGRDQTRAYVTVSGGEMTWGDTNLLLPQTIISVENSGETPARWFSVHATAFNTPDGAEESAFYDIDFSDVWPKRWNALGPKSTLTVPISTKQLHVVMREATLSEGKLSFNVAGVVKYETIFGEIFESEFWFTRRYLPGYSRRNIEHVGRMVRYSETAHKLQRRTCVIRSYSKVRS